ncbi:excinuclease ABC subunit B [Candidatus Woesearchaeota archaeon CG1_02_57_44]|nr:MAG: excinuclease ABC subunit B [Candidatus Woesearchaeota archaeon CG1_02_57_44]
MAGKGKKQEKDGVQAKTMMESVGFKLTTDMKPAGSQPEAIAKLVRGLSQGMQQQTLLGVTGSGKTFTMANVIAATQMPTLIIAHNKTLAAQLYQELKELFPENRVEYFVSYYDFYQPESYLPQTDKYIEKDAQVNPRLEQMRLSATASLLSRRDVIVVASVSCIYSVGDPADYRDMGFSLTAGEQLTRRELMGRLVDAQYERNDIELAPGRFRTRGGTIDLIPSYHTNIFRIEMDGNSVGSITELDHRNQKPLEALGYLHVFPAKHFVIPQEKLDAAMDGIRDELASRVKDLEPLQAHRLRQRTLHDLEMIQETGFCKGIENYSRHFDGRKPGEKPFCLIDYFSAPFLIFIDESHQTVPQLRAMYNGDLARKRNLVEYGFRLPSAYDNRPLKFVEIENYLETAQTVFVSATPAEYETSRSSQVVEQVIRPTGLLDPVVQVRPIAGQMDDLKQEIESVVARGDRALVTTLTKRLAEELTDYLARAGVKTRYLHSDIETLERSEIIRQLRLGQFDVLVGINLLREGLDIPEVCFIGILDADKEGFLRDGRSLIQTIGRAARNANSQVVLYADKETDSMKLAMLETARRRRLQEKFNKTHGIVPATIVKPIKEKIVDVKDVKHIPVADIPNLLIELDTRMREAADALNFEEAIAIRDRMRELERRGKANDLLLV